MTTFLTNDSLAQHQTWKGASNDAATKASVFPDVRKFRASQTKKKSWWGRSSLSSQASDAFSCAPTEDMNDSEWFTEHSSHFFPLSPPEEEGEEEGEGATLDSSSSSSFPLPSTRSELIVMLLEQDTLEEVHTNSLSDVGEEECSASSLAWADDHVGDAADLEEADKMFADYENRLMVALENINLDGDAEEDELHDLLQEGLFGECDSLECNISR